ncbi:endoglucanase [Pseudosulfitobacter pseudonitzschiae]|uniref:cellulase n=1 Tax=Pseudosulfitobacter pseudonitzschiae TaxID=1402135 RepID=A0A073IWG4_9RHOB|nr:glycosyl hydrolase family 8 [Pseudosulfitobacter pseudonitzschiae]KEJ93945.1 glycosyl hydrolase family 5 [Pseudosulfitobacter pseudonitzschiae]QKS08564.1 glycosyl hydrolase family 5 [Pseudosulfitobacter pseudonitzschiae]SHF78586.1 endoglucanase [Pseudosulfitobacter pseudonitzschiae]
MNRRHLLLALPSLAALPAWGQQWLVDAWNRWKSNYLASDGRVVDDGNGGISHSEGQAYGLLLAQAFGDRTAFNLIETWTQAKLGIRADGLMAWKWQLDGLADTRNATDGDLLRAWTLLRASRDSGWLGHEDKIAPICRALVEKCLAPDPRAPLELLLKPASHTTADGNSVILNPSYYMIRALIELGDATGEVELLRAAAHGERLLITPNALRDWINVTPGGIKPALNLSNNFGWDALRLPLYLFWSGRAAHPAMQIVSTRFAAAMLDRHVATVTDSSGKMLVQSDAAGFRAVADLAAGRPPTLPNPGQGYYADTLALLAQIAWREGK